MTVTVTIPDEVAECAHRQGLSTEMYVEQLVAQASQDQPLRFVRLGTSTKTPEEAGRDIREMRKGITLGGLKIKDLIHEGHKY